LPDIATRIKQDALSARICLRIYRFCSFGDDLFGFNSGFCKGAAQQLLFTRISFLLTGAWWFGFLNIPSSIFLSLEM
jgi:UMF1 family MFS transporter